MARTRMSYATAQRIKNIEEEFVALISNLPSELKWRILSFLPSELLLKLGLSNKQAWMVFNSTRYKSQPWEDGIDWISKLSAITLFVPESLFIFTLSDLHHHTEYNIAGYHTCFSMSVTEASCFKLVPLPQYCGFVLQNEVCVDIPWSEIADLSQHSNINVHSAVLTNGRIPKSSSVYKFLERELAHDCDVQTYFNRWRDPDLDWYLSDHILDCSECEWESSSDFSDDSYTPTSTDDDARSSDSCSEYAEDTVEDFRLHLDDLKYYMSEHERHENENRRNKILSLIQENKDDCENQKTGKKTVYCHNLNNYGYCSYYHGRSCNFLHQLAPVCWYDEFSKCTRKNCGYFHKAKPNKELADQVEKIELVIKNMEESSHVLESIDGENELEINVDDNDLKIADLKIDVDENDMKIEIDSLCKDPSLNQVCSNVADLLLGDMGGDSFTAIDDEMQDSGSCNSGNAAEEDFPMDVGMTTSLDGDFDSDPSGETYDDEVDDMLWEEFVTDYTARSTEEYMANLHQEKIERLSMQRKIYLGNHEKTYPFPPRWKRNVPSGNDFPVLFFLSKHPENMNRVHLWKKQRRENCFVWNVYEGKQVEDSDNDCNGDSNDNSDDDSDDYSNDDSDDDSSSDSDCDSGDDSDKNSGDGVLLGIAVMSVESCQPHLNYDEYEEYDPSRHSTCVFGSEKLLCIGDFRRNNNLPARSSRQHCGDVVPCYFNVPHAIAQGELTDDDEDEY